MVCKKQKAGQKQNRIQIGMPSRLIKKAQWNPEEEKSSQHTLKSADLFPQQSTSWRGQVVARQDMTKRDISQLDFFIKHAKV